MARDGDTLNPLFDLAILGRMFSWGDDDEPRRPPPSRDRDYLALGLDPTEFEYFRQHNPEAYSGLRGAKGIIAPKIAGGGLHWEDPTKIAGLLTAFTSYQGLLKDIRGQSASFKALKGDISPLGRGAPLVSTPGTVLTRSDKRASIVTGSK